ncbi:hypothetical protein BKA80DRAFT_304824 [Phyllosticta citrichinensis]
MEDESASKRAKLSTESSPGSTKPSNDAAGPEPAQKIQLLEIPYSIENYEGYRENEQASMSRGLYSDLIIKFADDQKMHVHKAILCSHSDVFHKASSDHFALGRSINPTFSFSEER